MNTIIISLQYPSPRGAIDLELPGNVMLNKLLPELVRVLQLPFTDNAGQPITYQLFHQSWQRVLSETDTLSNGGVITGDVLSLTSSAALRASARGGASSAVLRCESGSVIALDNFGKTELTIGRYDASTGKSPDIDLSEEPDGNTISRSHAILRNQDDQWCLVPISTKNSTRVGNKKLSPQQSWPLKSGDVISLGAVKLVFETGSSF